MVGQKNEKINQLHRLLPEGLVVDTPWLEKHGYRRQWREKYVVQGWLEGVVRGVYQRPTGNVEQTIAWQRVVISLQRLLAKPVHVGGRSALELQGLTHYLRFSGKPEIHLYAFGSLPGWVERIPTDAQFVEHRADKLFDADAPGRARIAWGHWGWELDLSAPERALCELLDLLPSRETFHQADVLMESVRTLSPKAFIFENVRGLTRPAFANYFNYTLLQLTHPLMASEPGETWTDHYARLQAEHRDVRPRDVGPEQPT